MTKEDQVEEQQSEAVAKYGDEKWLKQYQSFNSWSELGKSVGLAPGPKSKEKRAVHNEVLEQSETVVS